MDDGTRVAQVDTDTGWRLELFQIGTSAGDRFRVDVSNPEGRLVFSRSMAKSIDECCEGVRTFFATERLGHTAVVLVALVEAELAP